MAYTPIGKKRAATGYTPISKKKPANFITISGEEKFISPPTKLEFVQKKTSVLDMFKPMAERAGQFVEAIKGNPAPLVSSLKQQLSERTRIGTFADGREFSIPTVADALVQGVAGDGGGRKLPKKIVAPKKIIELPSNEVPLPATSPTDANVYKPVAASRNGAWPTTASKPSKAGSTSTGSAPTGKGGVSAQRAGTSGPFEGGTIKVYHGSKVADVIEKEGFKLLPPEQRNMASAYGDGIYLTTSKSDAQGWGGLVEAHIPKGLKLKKASDGDAYSLNTAKLKAEGYDGVEVVRPGGNHIVIFDPAKIKTKSQLASPSIPKELPKTDKLGRPLNHALAADPKIAPLMKEAEHFGYKVNLIDKKPSGYYGKHFQPDYRIDLFTKGRTPEEIASTLDHEIGHIADYQRRGITADPMGDSIRGFDGKDRPMADHDIYFRDSRKAEGEAIRAQFTRGDHAANTQKEIYADAFRLYKQNPDKLRDIAPRIFKEIDDWYAANKMGGTPKGDIPFDPKASGQTLAETPSTKRAVPQKQPAQTAQVEAPHSPASSPSPQPQSVMPYGGSISQDIYKANRAALPPSRIRRIGNTLSASLNSVREGADKLMGPISTRLKNIDPSLKQAMRSFEFKLGSAIQADRRAVAPFIKAMRDKKISKEDYADLDLALKNGDKTVTETLISKYGLNKEFSDIKTVLDDLYARAKEVDYDIGYEDNYFPRMVEDGPGLLEYLQKGDDWSIIDEAIKAKETDIGRYLTVQEKANLINTLVRGYGGKITLSETGAMKARRIELVDAQLNRFYRDSVESLLRYVDDTNEAIEARRFFGKGNPESSIEDSIGGYILDLLSKGKIKPSQEKELRDILQARFGQVGTSGVVKVYKNLSYIDTMGSFTSAITQIGDLAFALYKGGPVQTAKALGKAIIGKSDITRADLGIEKIAQEFEDASRSAQAVDKVFRLIGLHKMDALGKETVINATIGKYRKLAQNPTTDFLRRIEAVFGNDTARIVDDLKTGKITEDVKLLAFNELLDVQPVALSEMPEQYLKGGNGRIFYMLKTYTIKLFDVYRNEVFHEISAGNKTQGIKNLMYLTGALVAMNATADEIKDLMLNRETSLKDRTVDNILKLAGFSKFTLYKAREEGIGSAVAKTILPPFKFIDSAYKDITNARVQETPQSIPIGGKLYYWWFGKGQEKSNNKRDKTKSSGLPDLPKLPPLPTLPALPKLPALNR